MTRTTRSTTLFSLPVAVLLGLLGIFLGGCQLHRNEHGFQDTPPISRLMSIPQGARVIIDKPSLGKLELITPCDLPTELRDHDVISVSKEGYISWRGPIGELSQVARATYKIELRPVVPIE